MDATVESPTRQAAPSDTRAPGRWLLLLHSLPPDPAYFRVRVRRRLAAIGAVAVKNSVYALPSGDAEREDFAWLADVSEPGSRRGDPSVLLSSAG